MERRKDSAASQHFRPENLSEGDIEAIWKNMMQEGGKGRKMTGKTPASVDTTPTTDYTGNLIPLHAETLEEELKQDRELARMNSVLRAKKLKPKTYLPQVILYDNVSHDRMLSMRLEELRDAHQVAERRAKRRQETFVRSLQRKQEEWNRRDARMVAKLDPDNLPDLTFTFGRLYNKPDHPYQAAIQTLSTKQPPARALADHARRRPTILPQVTNRPIYDDEEEEDRTFITRLPKKQHLPAVKHTSEPGAYTERGGKEGGSSEKSGGNRSIGRRRGRRRQQKKRAKDWTADARFHTLTDILGERYSPKKKVRPRPVDSELLAGGLITTLL